MASTISIMFNPGCIVRICNVQRCIVHKCTPQYCTAGFLIVHQTRVLTSQGSRIEAFFGAAGGCSEMSVCSTFGKIRSCRSQRYRDCTKALFVSKGSYGYGEPKKVIAFVGAINALAVMSRQSTRFLAAPNRADNGNYIFRFSIPVSSFWYRHCFGANTVPWRWVATNIIKFRLLSVYGAAWNQVVFQARNGQYDFCTDSAIPFWGSLTRSLLSIQALLWCKHGTIAIGRPEFPQISIIGLIQRCKKPGTLPACNSECVYCTDNVITFLGSPYP